MTRDQVIKLVGQNNVDQEGSNRLLKKSLKPSIGRRNRLPHHSTSSSYRPVGQALSPVERLFQQPAKGDLLALKTAPKPHPAFEGYIVTISPEKGILKVTAIGVDVQTNGFGSELRTHFSEMRDAVSGNYGNPTKDYDFLSAGSLWKEPRYWMMGLLKKERNLDAYWISKKTHPESGSVELSNDISIIALGAIATSLEKGYLKLGFEFEGWESYLDDKKAKQNTVLK
jgi:hypothetical protein